VSAANRNTGLIRALRMAELLRQQTHTIYQLADTFGVTTRTVRRDITALTAAGIAIKAVPCEGTPTRFSIKGK
jgi:predicted DNA-binding transcriptional regulator YafY